MERLRTAAVAAALLTWWGADTDSIRFSGEGRVICEDRSVGETRTFVLERDPIDGRQWRLSLSAGDEPPIYLPLEDARPLFDEDRARLSYHSANGGLSVELDVTPARASLEIYVNYELEVNVLPDLAPGADELNTRGALTTVECRIAGPSGAGRASRSLASPPGVSPAITSRRRAPRS